MAPPTVEQLRQRALDKLTQGELRALRTQLRRELAAELSDKTTRPPRVREVGEVAAAARRMVKAVGERAADDVEALPLLANLADVVDGELRRAIDGARDPERHAYPYSWADVGRALGLTRQGAQQRFGRST